MKVMGDIVGLPSPRSDWNQDNPMKADYIKNKPEAEIQAINSLKYYGDANIVPSDASLFMFITDDATMTAQVSARDTDISGDIVIPYECVVDGKTYKVTKVGHFWDCTYIESVTIPGNVASILGSFDSCVRIKSLKIHDGVTSIETGACNLCTSLTTLEIPSSVTNIGAGAFGYCRSLADVYYEGTKEEFDKINISQNGNDAFLNATIHYEYTDVTKEYVDALKPIIHTYNDIDTDFIFIYKNVEYYYGVVIKSLDVYIETFGNGDIAAVHFSAPEIIPENYTYFDEAIKFKGDSVEDQSFVPEANTRYTIVFAHDGENIIGYVSGVSI